MAFDHDIFSFVDVTLGNHWPLVLMTNPKDSRFLAPTREPTERMLHSSHVRILIFSPERIILVKLEVDGLSLSDPVPIDGGPLYVSPWQPSKYAFGLHNIKVEVMDAVGQETTYKQSFSLDGTASPMDMLPQVLLLTDINSLVRL